jgi:hypothetical protein
MPAFGALHAQYIGRRTGRSPNHRRCPAGLAKATPSPSIGRDIRRSGRERSHSRFWARTVADLRLSAPRWVNGTLRAQMNARTDSAVGARSVGRPPPDSLAGKAVAGAGDRRTELHHRMTAPNADSIDAVVAPERHLRAWQAMVRSSPRRRRPCCTNCGRRTVTSGGRVPATPVRRRVSRPAGRWRRRAPPARRRDTWWCPTLPAPSRHRTPPE